MRYYPRNTERVVFLFEGRKIESGAKRVPLGDFTYCRLKVEMTPRAYGEKRKLGRLRTKLRSAKIFDRSHRSLVDCLIHDRSAAGARLRLMTDRPIPTCFRLVDDVSGLTSVVELVWRRGREIGVRLSHDYGLC